jgi:hypothetical protein
VRRRATRAWPNCRAEVARVSSSVETIFASLGRVRDLPARLESGLKTYPFVTAAVIAGVSFVGGMVLGSRFARAILVAASPAIVHRLLDGPVGDDLVRSIRGALRSRPVEPQTTS